MREESRHSASFHPIDLNIEELQAVFAIAELVLLMLLIAASGADKGTPSLRVTGIDPLTTCPALVNLDLAATVIYHIAMAAFLARHRSFYKPHPIQRYRIALEFRRCWVHMFLLYTVWSGPQPNVYASVYSHNSRHSLGCGSLHMLFRSIAWGNET
jgi:hypothetical protein